MEIFTLGEFKEFLNKNDFPDDTKLYVDFRVDKPVYDVGVKKIYVNGEFKEKCLIFDCHKIKETKNEKNK